MLARRGSAADGVEGSAGRVDGALYDVAVVDETGGAVAPGEVGELLVRPRLPWIVTDGYVGMAEETTAAFRDLWFHTGDCVRIDETGSLWFVDRLAERIRRRGENVASAEVERVLLEHPGIADAAVVAVPADDAGGEDEIKAVLVADGEGVDAAAVWSWCDERLPYFAVPRYVEFVPVLPKTATAKVQKTELRAAGVTSATADRGPAPSRRGRR
jgi:crotonobetaine/carnitine-CoA ligase